ncbi:MAG: tryptophan-rich sensory protein [Chloroflexi bacterium]|nr:tryptophan-rich sensory protein [Chloroflexota bacterium]
MKSKNSLWRWLSVLSFLLTVAVNGYANTAELNGVTTAEVSDTFNVLFVPAGYVFSIWGVIYLFLIAFLIYQFTAGQKDDPRFVAIAPYFVLSNLANGLWLVLFHYQQHYFTILPMLVLLVCLILIYLKLHAEPLKGTAYYFMGLPFSIYLGWVSVATIANMTQFLDYVGWSGFGLAPEIWFVIVLLVAVVLAWFMSRRFHDMAYNLVLVWAFIGIGVKFLANPVVAYSSFIAAVLVLVVYFVSLKRERD